MLPDEAGTVTVHPLPDRSKAQLPPVEVTRFTDGSQPKLSSRTWFHQGA